MNTLSNDFLPGTLRLERGTSGDYFALERFHYIPKRPATWAGVWVVRFYPESSQKGSGFGVQGSGWLNPTSNQEPQNTGKEAPTETQFRRGSQRRASAALRAAAKRGDGCKTEHHLNPEPRTLNPPRAVAVGVLSYPSVYCRPREHLLHLPKTQQLRWTNANLRTISRVIVHPQFRALGLASMLVRRMLHDCPTRWVEALAVMGRAHPFFEKAGMRRIDPEQEDQPIYFIHDRSAHAFLPLPPGEGRGEGEWQNAQLANSPSP